MPTASRRRTGSSSARTPVVRKAITAGEIDIYPEYTGNAAFFFNKADDPVWKDAAKGFDMAKKLDYDANKIVWLDPAPANNTWAIAMRKDVGRCQQAEDHVRFRPVGHQAAARWCWRPRPNS